MKKYSKEEKKEIVELLQEYSKKFHGNAQVNDFLIEKGLLEQVVSSSDEYSKDEVVELLKESHSQFATREHDKVISFLKEKGLMEEEFEVQRWIK